ncbi:MAG TPA: HAD hydrolase-like protein [Kofleriaceae bacterium]|nr:HAD hydrolase-like protein [Kofleriaceae bacterium]
MYAQPARFVELIDRYDGFLFDAYGVLVDASGPCPGAAEAIAAVRAAGKPLAVVTNDSSRLPATAAARFARVGLAIAEDEVVSSGQQLAPFVAERGLAGAVAMVLGNADARAYAAAAGLTPVEPSDDAVVDVLAVCDDGGFDFLRGMNAAISACVRALDAGRPLVLVCPNPDLVYPRGGGALGFTAGAMAMIIEAALVRRHPDAPRFAYLGKPHAPIFAAARRRLAGVDALLMVGDQLETDVAGARGAGLHAALVTGVSRWRDGATAAHLAPHWLLDGL